jgi:putative CocE/NonD family hydrolase
MKLQHRLGIGISIFTLFLALFGISGFAQMVSKPGEYSGYSEAQYDGYKRFSQYVTVQAGTPNESKLAVDIYRPTKEGVLVTTPLPVIWQHQLGRATYRSNGSMSLAAVGDGMVNLTKYGYIIAEVDRRGKGASYGSMIGYHPRNEARDAYDITEWLGTQPWSDGNVGMYGCSNTGEAVIHALTTSKPAHLKAVFPGNYSFNKYDGFLRGGIHANWGAGPDTNYLTDLNNVPVDGDVDGPDADTYPDLLWQAIQGHQYNTWLYAMWKDAPYRDSVSTLANLVGVIPAKEFSASTYVDNIRATGIPIYSYDSWGDDFRREMFVSFKNLKATNPFKAMISPGGHCQNPGFDIVTERQRYFDYWLKDIDNGIMAEPPIYYQTMDAPAGKEWRFSPQWPVHGTNMTKFYLQEGPSGSPSIGVKDGLLNQKSPKAPQGKDIFTVDYSVSCTPPVGLSQTCPQDSKWMTYTTEPLTEDTEVTGHPVIHLWLSINDIRGNVFAYLEDISPDGTVKVVTDGRLNMRQRGLNTPPYDFLGLPWHRGNTADMTPMTPYKPTELVFDMTPTSQLFRAGHRIRVSIAGADVREKDRYEAAPAPDITIYRDKAHQSYISLPIIPRNSVFTGTVKVRTKSVRYEGPADLYASPTAIYMNYDGSWLKWDTERNWEAGKTEHFKGRSKQGPISVVVTSSKHACFDALATGNGIYFKGEAKY